MASKLLKLLDLRPHPEGGFFKETFRDGSVQLSASTLPPQYKVDRPVSTAIYFLLPSGSVSRMHRIPSAEVWHFYAGEPLTVVEINDHGEVKEIVLGPNLEEGQALQYTVPPMVWFGCYPTRDVVSMSDTHIVIPPPRSSEEHFSLVGCTVAPGFQFEDFEMASRSHLCALFPHAKTYIELLTPKDEEKESSK